MEIYIVSHLLVKLVSHLLVNKVFRFVQATWSRLILRIKKIFYQNKVLDNKIHYVNSLLIRTSFIYSV